MSTEVNNLIDLISYLNKIEAEHGNLPVRTYEQICVRVYVDTKALIPEVVLG
jgi:hypothetical protein